MSLAGLHLNDSFRPGLEVLAQLKIQIEKAHCEKRKTSRIWQENPYHEKGTTGVQS
jgi:hypothetical protein